MKVIMTDSADDARLFPARICDFPMASSLCYSVTDVTRNLTSGGKMSLLAFRTTPKARIALLNHAKNQVQALDTTLGAYASFLEEKTMGGK